MYLFKKKIIMVFEIELFRVDKKQTFHNRLTLKFIFSKKATKIDEIFTVHLKLTI